MVDHIKFDFPSEKLLMELKKVQNMDQLQTKLKKNYYEDFGNQIRFAYRFMQPKDKNGHQYRLIADCRKCKCRLTYKKQTINNSNSSWILNRSFCSHHHELKRIKKKTTLQIQQYIQMLPEGLDRKSQKILTMHNLGVTNSAFIFAERKIRTKQKINFQEMIKFIQQNKPQIRLNYRIEQKQLPNLILITDNQSRKLYKKYGQMTSFDLTFSLFKQCRQNQQKSEYLLGFFAGSNSGGKTIIFGFAVMNSQQKNSYENIFNSFIETMGKSPSTIITDQQPSIDAALSNLSAQGKFTGNHYCDIFHIINGSKLSGSLKKLLSKMLLAPNKYQYNCEYSRVYLACKNDEEKLKLNKIHKLKQRCALAYITSFVGLGVSDSRNQSLHNSIKSVITHAQSYTQVVLKTITFMQKINQKIDYQMQKTPIQHIFGDNDLKKLRVTFAKPVLRFVLKQFSRAIKNTVSQISNQCYLVGIMGITQSTYRITKQIIWKCQCTFKQKTGICCEHIIACILLKGNLTQLIPQIDSRWYLEVNNAQLHVTKLGLKI